MIKNILTILLFFSFTLIANDKILVAYFSMTGNTKKIANYIKDYTKSDIFEISPLDKYNSSTMRERNLKERENNTNIELSSKIENIDKYDIIILGFPIWTYRVPQIIISFLRDYDLSNKIIIPFSTSAFTDIEDSITYIKSSLPNSATILSPKSFNYPDFNNYISIVDKWLGDIDVVQKNIF